MPEQQVFVARALEFLEDNTFTEGLSRNQHLEVIQKALESDETLSVQQLDRILGLCIHDLKTGVKQSSVLCLHIIATILKRVQNGTSPSDLHSSAETILHFLLTSATTPNTEALQTMCFNTLLDHPTDVLASLALENDDFWEIFAVFCDPTVNIDIRFLPMKITFKVLKTMLPDKKAIFVKKGMAVWFSKVVPCVMNYFQTISMITPKMLMSLEVLEILTEELVKLDYSNDPHWQTVLDNIYNPKKYPAIMKNLLVSGYEHWHRLWIIFIKLLEDQITMYRPGVGSPINSMLPVVETAFKLDVTNRCTAFKCWNVLIDVFSAEINEQYVEKRIKLLLIPLKLNNAKVEETALAKLDTWWHLIKQFETRMNNTILYPFLGFCFGKPVPDKVPGIIPGLISPKMKENCVKAFVELVGHVNCEGCGSQERLKGRLINTKVLVNYWNDWAYCLKMAIQMAGSDDVQLGMQPITCIWLSFVMTIAELPENNIRKDLFNELLAMIKQLLEENSSNRKLTDIIVNVLISSLFEEESIKPLLKIKEIKSGPLHQLLVILTLVEEYTLINKESSKNNPIKMITEFMAKECAYLLDETIHWFVNKCQPNETTLEIWVALTESLQSSRLRPKEEYFLDMLLRWPIRYMKKLTNPKKAATIWTSAFSLLNVKKKVLDCRNSITLMLNKTDVEVLVSSPLGLCALLSTIKASFVWSTEYVPEKEALLLHDIINLYNDYSEFDHAYPLLIDTLNLWVSKLPQNDHNLHIVASIMQKILKILNKEMRENVQFDNEKILMAANVIKPLFHTVLYVKIIDYVEEELRICRSLCKSQAVHLVLDFIMNLISAQKPTEPPAMVKETTQTPVAKLDTVDRENRKSGDISENEFTTPVPKSAKKNQKKKDANIVNTVVENGEEFAVIQSNWKFNPRKLTENQKEKLQRKREDIPALYQDLSQSQDEFKLKTWRPDSQDSTTTSRSASTASNEDISTVLKNIPETNIVPKIISNFFSESPKPDMVSHANVDDKNKDQGTSSPTSNKTDKTNSSPSVKTPRMALKDRVSRNVRNLIEKSTVSKEGAQKPDLLNQTVSSNIFNTPVTKCSEINSGGNSAPSKISADRPARVKRKPKKFDDTELFLLKKRRNSNNQADTQYSVIDNDSEVNNAPSENAKDPIIDSNKITDTVNEENPKIVDNKNENSEPKAESPISDEKNVDVQKAKQLDSQVVEMEVLHLPEKEPEDNKTNRDEQVDPTISEEIPDEVISCSTSDTSTEIQEDHSQVENNNKKNLKHDQSTPKLTPKRKDAKEVKSSTKKKSRIEKELAIDMVEGHPFLKLQSDKRVTRKCLSNTPNGSRRKNLTEKLNKSKIDSKNAAKPKKGANSKDSSKEKSTVIATDLSITVCETQDLLAVGTQDLSEDIIESSQDTTTTMSIKTFQNSTKKTTNVDKIHETVEETQSLIDDSTQGMNTSADVSMIHESKDDTEIPANKTDLDNARKDLTEEMDTQPTDDKNSSSGEVIVINDDEPIIVLNSEDTLPGPDTLELANADTEPINPSGLVNTNIQAESSQNDSLPPNNDLHKESNLEDSELPGTATDKTVTVTDITQDESSNNASSPSKDDDQRKKDFLNNTLEISPIKPLSPIEPKSPSPETSSDFLIVKLSGPIQINGEPLEISHSPEILTEEKSSPDKRDQSPPRIQITENKSSPSSSLSLKKNRPQVRAGGRAAQMLGLCVPERAQTITNIDKPESDEPKKNNVNTPVRRNLRMLYNPASDGDKADENEDREHFLRFVKVPPTADCSPAGPILKRKLAEISDEATVSPANKRKRVSFHDPVSTSVSVQKYIESSGVRSPQSSALKRLERQMRNSHMKSPKRLENLFKLDSMLVKTVESFTENNMSNDDTQLSSLEQTPAVEIVKTSELNDKDPIFIDLIDCKDSIHNIASELSSPAMKSLLVKELEGKIETVGDLAKMTELEVNRLCIRAPKVQVVKKVLGDYLNIFNSLREMEKSLESAVNTEAAGVHVEVQTSILTSETETQTSLVLQRLSSTQTDSVVTTSKGAQTEESGSKSTEDIITSCLQERKDFVHKLSEQLDQTSIRKLADCMSAKDCTDILVKNMTSSDTDAVFNQVLLRGSELHCSGQSGNKELSFLLNYLCDKFETKDLILFCSQILQKVHGKST